MSIHNSNAHANFSTTISDFNVVTDTLFASFYNKYYLLSISLHHACRAWLPVPSSSASTSPPINAKTKIWKEAGKPQLYGCNLNCIKSLNSNATISVGNKIVTRYFEAHPSTMSLLSTACSINNLNNDKDEFVSNNMNKNKCQKGYTPSLRLHNRYHINYDMSVTNASATPSNDKFIVLPLENETCTKTMWPEQDKLHGHDTEVTFLCCCDMLTIIASA